jgi:16S rRNA (uracil1498-N3)-methyltransferase
MSERFYINCPLEPGPVELAGAEAHHLGVVCRLGPGDLVCLFNGDGNEYPARIESMGRRRVTLEVLGQAAPDRELGFPLVVAVPVPKGERAHFLVEKLTELGATRFVPLATHRSVVHPRDLDRLRRHVIEACKQCGRNLLMEIDPVTNWADFCGRGDLPEWRILAHVTSEGGAWRVEGGGWRVRREAALPSVLQPAPATKKRGTGFALAVGPEGGFTQEEVVCAQGAGWSLVDLGPRTLRVETAALVLTAACAQGWAGQSGECE